MPRGAKSGGTESILVARSSDGGVGEEGGSKCVCAHRHDCMRTCARGDGAASAWGYQ